jgi:hypothetical protein
MIRIEEIGLAIVGKGASAGMKGIQERHSTEIAALQKRNRNTNRIIGSVIADIIVLAIVGGVTYRALAG